MKLSRKCVIGSRLAEIVKIANTRISDSNDADRESDYKVRRPAKLDIEIKSDWLQICFTFVMKSPLPKTPETIKLKHSYFHNTLLRHTLQVIPPVRHILSCYHGIEKSREK